MQCIFEGHNSLTLVYVDKLPLTDNGGGHIAIAVDDAYQACEAIKARGGNVVREAGPMKGGVTVIAFVEDPDGYKIELIQQYQSLFLILSFVSQ